MSYSLFQILGNSSGNNADAIKQTEEAFTVLFDCQTACINIVRKAIHTEAFLSMSDRAQLGTLLELLLQQRNALVRNQMVPSEHIIDSLTLPVVG